MNPEGSFCPLNKNELKDILPFNPVENLGQNFLTDTEIVKEFVDLTILGADVVEIGSGPANLTVGIAEKANDVIGLEIFPEYADIQSSLTDKLSNVKIITQDALKFDYKKWVNSDRDAQHQVIGNIPFNISEPLLTILAKVGKNIDNITFIVGENLSKTITEKNPDSHQYTKLSFIAGVFDVEKVRHIPSDCFWPAPKTDADIVSLTPLENSPRNSNVNFQLHWQIIKNQELSLEKIIRNFSPINKNKSLSKKMSNRADRRQTNLDLKDIISDYNSKSRNERPKNEDYTNNRSLINRMKLSQTVLSKPFKNLNNEEVKELAVAINKI